MVVATKPNYSPEVLDVLKDVQYLLSQRFDIPHITEGGLIYKTAEELLHLQLLESGLLKAEADSPSAFGSDVDTSESTTKKQVGRVEEVKTTEGFLGGIRQFGGLGKVAGKIKASVTSKASAFKEGWDEAASDPAKQARREMLVAGAKSPTSDLYRRAPKEYIKRKGALVSRLAHADVAFDAAGKEWEAKGDDFSQEFRVRDEDGNSVKNDEGNFEMETLSGNAAMNRAALDYGREVRQIKAGAADIGTEFNMVQLHLERTREGNNTVMPPSDYEDADGNMQSFPDAATPSGGKGSGKALTDALDKNLKGSRWTAAVRVKGSEAWKGKVAAQAGFKAPTAEQKQLGEGEADIQGILADPKGIDQAIANMPKGEAIESGDREYLNKPGQEPPEGVQVQYGEVDAQGKRARFYSKKEAKIRKAAREQQAERITGTGDVPGEGKGDEQSKAERAALHDAAKTLEGLISDGKMTWEEGDKQYADYKSSLKAGRVERLKKRVLKDPMAEYQKPEDGDDSGKSDDSKSSNGSDDSKSSNGSDDSNGSGGSGGSNGSGGSKSSNGSGDSDDSNGSDDSGDSNGSDDSGQPHPPPTPTEIKLPRSIQNIADRMDRIAERSGRLVKTFGNTSKGLDDFIGELENGTVKIRKKGQSDLIDDIQSLRGTAATSRKANRKARNSVTRLLATATEEGQVGHSIKALNIKKKDGSITKEEAGELSQLAKDMKKLTARRKKQVVTARNNVTTAGTAQTDFYKSFGTINSSMRDLRANQPKGLRQLIRGALGDLTNLKNQVFTDPLVSTALYGGAMTADLLTRSMNNEPAAREMVNILDMADDLIEKQEMDNGDYSSLYDRIDDYLAA